MSLHRNFGLPAQPGDRAYPSDQTIAVNRRGHSEVNDCLRRIWPCSLSVKARVSSLGSIEFKCYAAPPCLRHRQLRADLYHSTWERMSRSDLKDGWIRVIRLLGLAETLSGGKPVSAANLSRFDSKLGKERLVGQIQERDARSCPPHRTRRCCTDRGYPNQFGPGSQGTTTACSLLPPIPLVIGTVQTTDHIKSF